MDTFWNILGNAKEIEWKEVESIQQVTTELLKVPSPGPSLWWVVLSHPFVIGVIAIGVSSVVWHYKGQINYFVESRIFKPGKRSRVIQEILDTEKSYVAVLQLLMSEYVEPLIGKYATPDMPKLSKSNSFTISYNSKNLINVNIDREILKSILPPTIEIMKNTNEILLKKLELRTQYGILDSTCVGDIFLELVPFLKCYTSFINNFDASTAQINLLMKNKERFRDFVNYVASKNPGADLHNLLICPVQRLPRYVLLFQELLKATPEDHKDRKDVALAVEKLKEITSLLNQNKHLNDNQTKVMRVEKKLKIKHDLTRRWIKEGLLTYMAKESVMCYLFTDCIVLAKKTTFPKEKYTKLMVQIPLLELDFVESPGALVAGLPFSFVLKASSKDPNGIGLSASSQQEAKEWIAAIQEATSKVKREASKRTTL
mmetsp:Transcript_20010/g.28006  ORF Transcript_20010/g.28006 Transcript_20010/m.28006 type:complete len:429 (+) Transcript_20010:3-1289(+)